MSLYDDVLVKKRQKENKEALAVEAFRTCLDELCEGWAEDACRKIKQEMLLLEKRGSASGVIHYYAPFAADLSTEQARRYLPFAPTYSEDYYVVDDVVFDLWGKRVVLKCFNEFGYSSVDGAQGNRCGIRFMEKLLSGIGDGVSIRRVSGNGYWMRLDLVCKEAI